MVMNLVKIFSNLGKTSVLGNLELYGDLHVDLRIDCHFDLAIQLGYSSSRQHHFSSHLVLELLPTKVTCADAPVLIVLLECVFDVLEVSRRHHQYLLIREVNQSSVPPNYFILLLELFDVAVEFLLEFEIIGYRLIGVDITRKPEEVNEDVALAFLIAVEAKGIRCVRICPRCSLGNSKEIAQQIELILKYCVVGMFWIHHIAVVLRLRFFFLLEEASFLLVAVLIFGQTSSQAVVLRV